MRHNYLARQYAGPVIDRAQERQVLGTHCKSMKSNELSL